jgi:hypothetical protein
MASADDVPVRVDDVPSLEEVRSLIVDELGGVDGFDDDEAEGEGDD